MVAIIGGETHHFRPLIDLYHEAGKPAGHPADKLKVGLHSLGYVGESTEKAKNEFYPGYAEGMTKIGRERGWAPMNRARFEAQAGQPAVLGDDGLGRLFLLLGLLILDRLVDFPAVDGDVEAGDRPRHHPQVPGKRADA